MNSHATGQSRPSKRFEPADQPRRGAASARAGRAIVGTAIEILAARYDVVVSTLLAFGAEVLEGLHRFVVRRLEGVLDRPPRQDLAEHVGPEVGGVQRVQMRLRRAGVTGTEIRARMRR